MLHTFVWRVPSKPMTTCFKSDHKPCACPIPQQLQVLVLIPFRPPAPPGCPPSPLGKAGMRRENRSCGGFWRPPPPTAPHPSSSHGSHRARNFRFFIYPHNPLVPPPAFPPPSTIRGKSITAPVVHIAPKLGCAGGEIWKLGNSLQWGKAFGLIEKCCNESKKMDKV